MNKRCFRLIFSKSLGFLIPVAETTKAQRKPGQQTTATSPPKSFNGSLKHLVLSMLLASLPGLTLADILPDANKPSGTSVINAANGVPVIEIANPNDKGLSHNRFSQFDVPQPGVIFNNSRVNGVSQLGGMVLLNPNLQRAATAILTEVTGNRPSSINGTLEVFGDKADLLIAKAFAGAEDVSRSNLYRWITADGTWKKGPYAKSAPPRSSETAPSPPSRPDPAAQILPTDTGKLDSNLPGADSLGEDQ